MFCLLSKLSLVENGTGVSVFFFYLDCRHLQCCILPTVHIHNLNLRLSRSEISLLHGVLICGAMFIWKREVIHGLFPVLYSFLAAEHFLSNWHFSVQRTRMSDAVKKLLSSCKDLYLLQKKSLHFVQENELLLRGFTLYVEKVNFITLLVIVRK